MDTSEQILRCFLQGKYQRMECPQCENTFLTNVYSMECNEPDQNIKLSCKKCRRVFIANTDSEAWRNYVILEKYALGLEYFCDAIQQYGLKQIPLIRRIGVLGEDDRVLEPSTVRLFSDEEPDYRLIYVMERLEHLDEADAGFFTEHLHDIDWMDDADRQQVWEWIAERYGLALAEDIRKLCRYFREHEAHVSWDLHGDNLMRRVTNGEIVVMDPFVPK